MTKNVFNSPSKESYDKLCEMLIPIANLATDPATMELMNILQDNKDKKMIETLGVAVTKLFPYLVGHKEDAFTLISCFYVREIEETEKKSIIELKNELVEVYTDPQVRELFTFAQTNSLDNMFGSAQESTEGIAPEGSSSTLKLV